MEWAVIFSYFRGWLIFSSLILGVLFRVFKDDAVGTVGFFFSEKELNAQSWIYFTMEHIIALQIAACLLIHDNTPRILLKLFFFILFLDLLHYLLFFRDEGIGWNLIKSAMFGVPLAYFELKKLWTLSKH